VCYWEFSENYHNHPAYNRYAAVGITQKQAETYSKWRSDRVFEFNLAKSKIIEFVELPTKETHFTIEKFYKGEIKILKPEYKNVHYPHFRLPTREERAKILFFSDSITIKKLDKCRSKFCKICKESWPEMHSQFPPCVTFKSSFDVPLRPGVSGCSFSNIYNLRGNVGEWLAEPNLVAGGGWNDKRTDILANDVQYLIGTNAWTGFRNVCEWKKWEE
jgi:hypothetical protein